MLSVSLKVIGICWNINKNRLWDCPSSTLNPWSFYSSSTERIELTINNLLGSFIKTFVPLYKTKINQYLPKKTKKESIFISNAPLSATPTQSFELSLFILFSFLVQRWANISIFVPIEWTFLFFFHFKPSEKFREKNGEQKKHVCDNQQHTKTTTTTTFDKTRIQSLRNKKKLFRGVRGGNEVGLEITERDILPSTFIHPPCYTYATFLNIYL